MLTTHLQLSAEVKKTSEKAAIGNNPVYDEIRSQYVEEIWNPTTKLYDAMSSKIALCSLKLN
jgi:hypothetical protein